MRPPDGYSAFIGKTAGEDWHFIIRFPLNTTRLESIDFCFEIDPIGDSWLYMGHEFTGKSTDFFRIGEIYKWLGSTDLFAFNPKNFIQELERRGIVRLAYHEQMQQWIPFAEIETNYWAGWYYITNEKYNIALDMPMPGRIVAFSRLVLELQERIPKTNTMKLQLPDNAINSLVEMIQDEETLATIAHYEACVNGQITCHKSTPCYQYVQPINETTFDFPRSWIELNCK